MPDANSRRRDRVMTIMLGGTTLLLIMCLVRVAHLEIAPNDRLQANLGRRTRSSVDFAFRGPILDRRGRVLAASVLGRDLAVDVKVLGDDGIDRRDVVAEEIAGVTGLDASRILERLNERDDARYVRLARAEELPFLEPERLTGLRIDGERVRGIILDRRPVRRRLEDTAAAPLIGGVRAVEWGPSPSELDRLASNVAIDVEGIRRWCRRSDIDTDRALRILNEHLAQVLGIPAEEVARRLDGATTPVVLASAIRLSPAVVERVRSLSIDERTPPRRLVLEIVDREAYARLMRRYPIQRGASGVEAARETTLQARHGTLRRTVAATGDTLFVDEGDFEPGHDGDAVMLTIDLEIQRYAEARLSEAIEDHHAIGGWVVVADPLTGEILAAVDVLHNDRARERGGWREIDLDPARDPKGLGRSHQRNRVWTDAFEPGSTFKALFWAWAVDQNAAQPDEVLPTPGGGFANPGHVFTSGRHRRRIRDVYGHEDADFQKCLVKSLNTGMAFVAERMSSEQMQEMITRFGFRDRTGIDMGPAEQIAMVSSPEQWHRLYTQLSVSFGQEISVTPLQLVRAFCAVARPDGGVPLLNLVRPSEVQPFTTPAPRAISPETVRVTREALERVVGPDGTGRKAASERYRIFGKSGTPQMNRYDLQEDGTWKSNGHHEDRYMPNFIAGAPFDAPRLVVACGLQDPDKHAGANLDGNGMGYGGGYSAGRVVRDVIDFTLVYLGVPSDRTTGTDEIAIAR